MSLNQLCLVIMLQSTTHAREPRPISLWLSREAQEPLERAQILNSSHWVWIISHYYLEGLTKTLFYFIPAKVSGYAIACPAALFTSFSIASGESGH